MLEEQLNVQVCIVYYATTFISSVCCHHSWLKTLL